MCIYIYIYIYIYSLYKYILYRQLTYQLTDRIHLLDLLTDIVYIYIYTIGNR